MDKLIPLIKCEKLEEANDDLPAPSDDHDNTKSKIDLVDVKLEDLHHSIDIKEEHEDNLEYQEDINEGTPSHSSSLSQIKTEEVKFNLDQLHHHPINIQNDISVQLQKTTPNCNSLTTRKISGDKPFKCEICDYQGAHKGYLKNHLKKHSGDKLFQCEMCDYKATRMGHLRTHLRTHTGDKPFECKICEYKSARKDTFETHLRKHSGDKPFECQICDYKAADEGYLRSHLRTHSGDKPFKCDICDFKSARKKDLKIHLRTHSGDKPFECKICEYKSVRRENLKRHLKTHSGETSSVIFVTKL